MKNSFSYWIRGNLKSSYEGLISQDIDFALLNEEHKNFFFIEEKNSLNAVVGPAQKVIFKLFDDFLMSEKMSWKFLGTSLVYATGGLKQEHVIKLIKNGFSHKNKELTDREIANLWDCRKTTRKSRPTRLERSGYRNSLLEDILKGTFGSEGYMVQKVDWIFVNYCSGYFILIEEINAKKKLTDNERRRFLKLLDQIFNEAERINRLRQTAKNPKSGRVYSYLGMYILEFSGNNPDDSRYIKINGDSVEKEELIYCLNLDDNSILRFGG